MLTLIGFVLAALIGLLQTAVLPVLLPSLLHVGVRPDLLVLLVIAVTLAGSLQDGVLWGFFGGLLLDLLAGLPLGSNALCLVLVALAASLGSRNPFRAHLVMPLALAFGGTGLYYLLLLGLRTVQGQHFAWGGALLGTVLPTALFNAALMPLLYSAVLWLVERCQPRLPQEWQ